MDCPPLDDVLVVAKDAARLAADQIRRAWNRKTEVKDTKSCSVDLVTETDRKCEELIIERIRKTYPSHVLIGEETAGASRYDLTDAPTWTIDPIDGTTNFVHRLALSCVLISFIHKKEVVVGVTLEPMSGELFWAAKAGGAYMQSAGDSKPVPIRTSGTMVVPQAVISMDPGYGRDEASVTRFESTMGTILRKGARGIRILASTGLNMAYVACGRMDAAFEVGTWETSTGPKIWDFSAGRLIVEEAGGVTRNLVKSVPDREPIDLLGRSFMCAATSELADEVVAAIHEAKKTAAAGPSAKRQKCE